MPVPTDVLNQDLGRLVSEVGKLTEKFDHAVERLTDKIDSNNTEFHGFRVEVTKQLSSLQTTAKVAGTVVTVLATIAIYFSRNAYQTAFAEGEKVGTLQAKMATIETLQTRFDMMEKAFFEHLKNPVQPTSFGPVSSPHPDPATKDRVPDHIIPAPVPPTGPDIPSTPDPIDKPANRKPPLPAKPATGGDSPTVKPSA